MINKKIKDSTIKIRQFKKKDTEKLYNYFKKLNEKTKYFFHPHPFDKKTAEKLTSSGIDDPQTLRFMATINNKSEEMIGYVFFWDLAKEMPWLGISVRDDWQGKGLGEILMNFAEKFARKNNKKGIQLTTMKDNTKAQNLYSKIGYEISGEKDGEYWLKLIFE